MFNNIKVSGNVIEMYKVKLIDGLDHFTKRV